jgi:iron(III) transport system permease protein
MQHGTLSRRVGEALLFASFALLVLAPIGALVVQAVRPLVHGQSWNDLLGPEIWANLFTTIQLASLTAAFSLIAGALLAALIHAAPERAQHWLEPLLLGSFLIPPYLTAVAWSLIAGPTGLWNQAIGHGGIALGKLLYTLPGIAIVMAMHLTPLVFAMGRAALLEIDHRLIETAQVHGASPLRARWMAYRPGVVPALFAATLLVFLAGAEEFGVPKILGDLAGIQVLSVSVEQALDVWPVNLSRAASIGLLLGALALVIWLTALPLTRITPTTTHKRTVKAQRWCALPPLAFIVIAAGLPLMAIGATALQKAVTNGLASDNWTWKHFQHVLSPGDGGLSALQTSIELSIGASLIGMALAITGLFVIQRFPERTRRLLEVLGYAPQAIPGVVMATGLILFWNAPGNPLPVYDHVSIIGIAYLALTLPYALRYAASGLQQIPVGLSHAASVHGAAPSGVLTRVLLPLAWPHILSGAAVLFAFSMRELAASILLQPPGTQVISTYIYAQFDQGNVNDGMALALVGMGLTFAVLASMRGINHLLGQAKPIAVSW